MLAIIIKLYLLLLLVDFFSEPKKLILLTSLQSPLGLVHATTIQCYSVTLGERLGQCTVCMLQPFQIM